MGFNGVRLKIVAVADGRMGWVLTLRSLFRMAFPDLFGEIVDVILRHEHPDAVDELLMRPGARAEYLAFLHEVDFNTQLVNRHVVFEVAIQPVGLLNQDGLDGGRFLEEMHHLAKVGPPRLLCGLNVYKFFDDLKAILLRVLAEQLELRRNGEPFFLLLLAGHTGVENSFDAEIHFTALILSVILGYSPSAHAARFW